VQEQVRQRLLASFKRFPPATTALVACIVLVHLAVGMDDWLMERSFLDERIATLYDAFMGARTQAGLLAWGANETSEVSAGATWRLGSSVFLHADLLHLSLNMLALFGLGRLCEAVYGSTRILVLFLVAGLAGALLSHLGRVPGAAELETLSMSVGASGAVFGLMGAGVVYGRRFRRQLPPPVRSIFWRGLMPWIVLNIFIGITVPRIDNLGHIGGLIAGAVLALLLGSPIIPGSEGRPGRSTLMGFAAACVLGWIVSAVFFHRLGV